MARIIQTGIYTEEMKEFRDYLEAQGFTEFRLFPSKRDKLHLNIYFENPATIMNYVLRGVEADYKAARSNKYFYDLDQDWDEEAENFFDHDDESND